MKDTKTSHRALVGYAAGLVVMVCFTVGIAFLFTEEKAIALWRGNFGAISYSDLFFFAMLIVACMNGILYAVRLVTWGRLVSETPHSVLLPFISRIALKVPPSVRLRVMMFIRDKSTLSDLTGTIEVHGNTENLLKRKGLAGRHGTNAKVALLRVKPRDNDGQIFVHLKLDWRRLLRFPGRDPSKNPLQFDIIVRAEK